MRVVVLAMVLAGLPGLGGCGGKLVPTLDSFDGDAGAAEAPETPSAPTTTNTAADRDCSPAAMTTTDYGIIDVSKLECTCTSNDDCDADAICVQFPALASPRCTHVKEACDLVTCRAGGCVAFGGAQEMPTCYR